MTLKNSRLDRRSGAGSTGSESSLPPAGLVASMIDVFGGGKKWSSATSSPRGSTSVAQPPEFVTNKERTEGEEEDLAALPSIDESESSLEDVEEFLNDSRTAEDRALEGRQEVPCDEFEEGGRAYDTSSNYIRVGLFSPKASGQVELEQENLLVEIGLKECLSSSILSEEDCTESHEANRADSTRRGESESDSSSHTPPGLRSFASECLIGSDFEYKDKVDRDKCFNLSDSDNETVNPEAAVRMSESQRSYGVTTQSLSPTAKRTFNTDRLHEEFTARRLPSSSTAIRVRRWELKLFTNFNNGVLIPAKASFDPESQIFRFSTNDIDSVFDITSVVEVGTFSDVSMDRLSNRSSYILSSGVVGELRRTPHVRLQLSLNCRRSARNKVREFIFLFPSYDDIGEYLDTLRVASASKDYPIRIGNCFGNSSLFL